MTSFGKWIDSKKTLFQGSRKNLGEVSFKCERELFAEVGTPQIKKRRKLHTLRKFERCSGLKDSASQNW